MKIAIDARALSWTGIGRYTRNLLLSLARSRAPHQYIVLHAAQERSAQELGLPSAQFSYLPVEGSYYSWREQTVFWRQLENIDADLWHFTHFNVPALLRRPYVVTIHDITRFIFPGQKRQDLFQQAGYELVFSSALKNARAAICVSNTTLADLQSLPLALPPATEVIPEGVEEHFFAPPPAGVQQKVPMLIGTNAPYLLYVGVWMSHKNLLRLLDAFGLVRRHHPALRLVVCGKPVPGYSNMVEEVRSRRLDEAVVFPGFVPHDLLPALYAGARAFVFPSLYEGFGLPPLEAAACGTPVVASNVSSLPEVLGPAAQYVNPEYVPDIAAGIRRVLEDEGWRQTLIAAGRRRARQFSWAACGEKTLAVYEKAGKQ